MRYIYNPLVRTRSLKVRPTRLDLSQNSSSTRLTKGSLHSESRIVPSSTRDSNPAILKFRWMVFSDLSPLRWPTLSKRPRVRDINVDQRGRMLAFVVPHRGYRFEGLSLLSP